LLWLLLALAPFLGLVAALYMWYVDVPFRDDFAEVPLVARSFDGTLAFADLWASHSEHRAVFPRLLVIANAHLTGWDTSYEAALQVLFAAGILALLLGQVSRTWRACAQASPPWLPVLFSLALFSLGQWENWFWGGCLSMTLCLLSSVAALVLLCSPRFRWFRLLAAVALAVVGTYSLGPGVTAWPVGLLVLLLQVRSDRRYLTQAVPVWLAVSAANYVAYTHNFHATEGNASPYLALAQPGQFLTYVTCYLGAPLWFWLNPGAQFLGTVGLLAVPVLSWYLLCRRRMPLAGLLPWLAVYLYAVGNAVMTGLGRLQLGMHQGLSSRYIPVGTLLWVVLAALLALALATAGPAPLPRRALRTGLATLAFLAMAFFLVDASVHGLPWAIRRSIQLNIAIEGLRAGDPAQTADFFGTPEQLAEGRALLIRHRLSIFRPGVPAPPRSP
jgi:hypothetical protein